MPELEEKLLGMTEEAAVLSRGALAVYANAAARDLLGQDCVGKRIDELFGELVNGVQAPDFLAQIQVNGRPWQLRIGRLGRERVFFLHEWEALPALLNLPFLYALRSNLMNLALAADSLRARAEERADGAVLESLRAVTRSQFRIQRLANNASLILDYSRGEAAPMPRVFDLSVLCASLLEAVSAAQPALKFVGRLPDRALIDADPLLIKELLLNLLSNAMRHAEGCSRITLSLLQARENLVLALDDDGCGIPGEELPRVFDRYRHSFSLDQMGAGAGLGLTAARIISQLQGGALLLESRPGQGTTVRVSLRRGEAARLRAPETEPEWESRELLTGLADCLPESCFDQRFLD